MRTGAEFEILLAEMLAGTMGGEPAHWREVIGHIEVLSLATHPKCNWAVVPQGTDAENAAVYLAAEVVRAEHPHARR